MTQSIQDLRQEYTKAELLESNAASRPFEQFGRWFDEALKAEVPEPNAMTLATVDADGQPSARIVLMKGLDDRGMTFFTNYLSRKGREIAGNPKAALVFFWPDLERQVRLEGTVEKVSEAESDDYYQNRPRGSRLGAWSSVQSAVVPGREALEDRLKELASQYGEGPIPRPPHWGGYRLVPHMFEFWQGRPSRLHDRLRYRVAGGIWVVERLSP